jgi:hypothetical protein
MEEDETPLEAIVGKHLVSYVPLIHQLIFCEDAYYKRQL